MLRILPLLLGLAACFSTSAAQAITPQDHPLCKTAPALKTCSAPPFELTIQSIRDRLDALYEVITSPGQNFISSPARWYARRSFIDTDFRSDLADYRDIRDRALTIIQQASNEEGERFFDLAEINNATHRANDLKTTLAIIEEARALLRSRSEDEDWVHKTGDTGTLLSIRETWSFLALDVARLGEAALAQDIFDEGWTEELRETFAYNAGLAWRFAIAEDYPQAEWFARAALELLPTAKGLEIGAGFDEMTAYYVLIIGLAKQDKPYDDAIMSFREYLKSQEQDSERLAEEYYFTAFVLADAVPGAARLFLQHARELHPKGGDGDLYEMWACEKLQDDECLLDMVHRREVSPQFAAELYARAGDGESMRRALQKLKAVHPCRISTYEVLIRRLTVDKNFGEAEAWVGNLVQCQLPHEPNYPKRVFFATSSNRWGDIARVYDVLSYAQSEAGMQEEALESAQAALILIREMDLTWNDKIAGPQSLDIIPPLAKTLGALATAKHRR